MHKILTRKLYLDKLINSLNNTKIKLITGYKSVGKSTILKQLTDYIDKNIANSNLIYIDDFYIKKFKTYQEAKDYIFAKHKVDKVNYLLIDDIQVCPDYKQLINDIYATKNFNIVLAGSNSYYSNTYLTNSFNYEVDNILILPFSFKEFVEFNEYKNIDEAFTKYIWLGGFPFASINQSLDEIEQKINNDYSFITAQDKLNAYKDNDSNLLKDISSEIFNRIKILTNLRFHMNQHKDVEFEKLSKSYNFIYDGLYLAYQAKNHCWALGTIAPYRNYLVDHTLLKVNNDDELSNDYLWILKNIVAIELIRRGYYINDEDQPKSKIDFDAYKPVRLNETFIKIIDEKTYKTDLNNQIKDLKNKKFHFIKLLLVDSNIERHFIDNVEVKSLQEWLLE